MSATTTPPPIAPANADAAFSDATLRDPPALVSPLDAEAALAALESLARKGRLPGFERDADGGFRVALFGEPFDMDLIGWIAPTSGGVRVTFRTRLRLKAPAILIAGLALSVWPGLPLLDAMIPASWGWWPTWWWYLPLVIGPLPIVLPKLARRSRAVAAEHLREQLVRIAGALDATPVRCAGGPGVSR